MAKPKTGFFEALFGLMLRPAATTRVLIQGHSSPPYGATLLLCLFLTVFVPIFAQQWKYGVTSYRLDAVWALLIVFFFTLLVFILLEGIFLLILGINVSANSLIAIVGYALTPLTLALWLIYAFNYFSYGSLSLVTFFLSGQSGAGDTFLRIVPLALLIAQVMVILVFFYAIRTIGEMHYFTGLLSTLISFALLYVSFVLGVFIADVALPGTADTFSTILVTPSRLTAFSD